MNVKETAGLLAYFASAWPNQVITDGQADVWAEQLIGVDPDDGRDAARSLVAQSKWFPTIAEFREACAAAERARKARVPQLTEPRPPVETSRDLAREGIRAARAALANNPQETK